MKAAPLDTTALDFLVARLSWPVPMVRWRAARALRDLLENDETKEPVTSNLLRRLSSARFETEVGAVLNVFLTANPPSRPDLATLQAAIRRPSILSSLLLRQMYGRDSEIDWRRSHSGPAPRDFHPSAYFEEHRTAHVPPVLSSRLEQLERHTGLRFMQQWAFEWQAHHEASGVSKTGFPYYFTDFASVRCGIIGQYIQGQGELYRSAYLRALAFAYDVWRMPLELAERYVMDLVAAVPGMFDVDPVQRPSWFADIPEQCAKSPDNLDTLAREAINLSRGLELRPVSLKVPVDQAVAEHAQFSISAYVVTDEFEGATVPRSKLEIADFTSSLSLEGHRPECRLEEYADDGPGAAAPVCTTLLPEPFGYWQGHYFATGLPIAAGYMLPERVRLRCTRSGVELLHVDRLIGRTAFWHDRWSPSYPHQGNTRCGVVAALETDLLHRALHQLHRKLVWRARIRVWRRASDFDKFEVLEKTTVFRD